MVIDYMITGMATIVLELQAAMIVLHYNTYHI
jgi:hypothetical protein